MHINEYKEIIKNRARTIITSRKELERCQGEQIPTLMEVYGKSN
jgi:hypothetical protein